MAPVPVCTLCKRAISSLHPGKPYRPRMAAYSALPETVETTNRTRRAAVARGDRTAKKATAVMTTPPGRCCCEHLYFERGGTSSYYCPEGNRLLCEECATRGAVSAPHKKSPLRGEHPGRSGSGRFQARFSNN